MGVALRAITTAPTCAAAIAATASTATTPLSASSRLQATSHPRENIQPRDINLPPNANSARGFESKGNSIVPVILYNEIKTKLKGVGLEIYKR